MSRRMMWLSLFGMFVFVMLVFRGCAALLSSVTAPTPTAPPPAKVAPAVAPAPIAGTATAAPAPVVTETPEAVTAPAADEKTLDITLDQYVRNFNAIGAELELDARASVGEITTGPVNDVVQLTLDEHRIVNVTLKKGTRTVKEATLIGSSDGTQSSAIYMMLTALVVAQAACPEPDRAAIGEAMGHLLKRMKLNADSVNEVVGERKLWMMMSTVTGFMAGIGPAKEE